MFMCLFSPHNSDHSAAPSLTSAILLQLCYNCCLQQLKYKPRTRKQEKLQRNFLTNGIQIQMLLQLPLSATILYST